MDKASPEFDRQLSATGTVPSTADQHRSQQLVSKLIFKRNRAKSPWSRPEAERARRRAEARREPFLPTTPIHGFCSRLQRKAVLKPGVIAWATTAILLGFLGFVQLGVLLACLTSPALLPLVVPVAGAAALITGDYLGRRQGLYGRRRLLPIGLAVTLTLLAVAVSAAFYDLSWDGQWYHQVGVYRIAAGWNPLKAPMQAFAPHNTEWVRHYAKGPWYIGAAMMALFHHIEWGKFVTWITLDAAFLAVWAACLDAGMRRTRALALAAVVALNPLVTSESLSYLVDGLMVSYLACYVAALFSGFRRANPLIIFTGAAAVIGSINAKFTGLVFLCFVCAGAGLYCLIKRRNLVWRFTALNLAAIVLGTAVFGYNPYITNMIHRGNPFYPLLGSAAHPSHAQQYNDQIEKYETPHNMMGRPRLVRFGYALFGRPGSQPFFNGPDARLMWPFLVPLKDLGLYRFHEVRIAGFGPLFSGVLLISLALTVWLWFRDRPSRWLISISCLVLAASLLISKHTWWARYGPQMWWLALVPLVLIFRGRYGRVPTGLAWGLIGLLTVNILLVTAIRLHWEVTATHTLRRQLTTLRDSGREIEIDMQWFGEPVGERLKTWGIPYQILPRDSLQNGRELVSVVCGYPGTIHYRIK